MAKWNIVVFSGKNHYTYTTDSDDQKTKIVKDEKKKSSVIEIYVNSTRCYKK